MRKKLSHKISICLFSMLFSFSVFPTASAQNSNPKVLNLTTPGNLASSHNLDCIPIEQVKNQYTPADLFPAVSKCIRQKRYDEASNLFFIAGIYGAFDKQRVADRTAHQGLQILIMTNVSTLPKQSRVAWQKNLKGNFKLGNPKHKELCQSIRKLGPPDYYPKYMIQHGIRAFSEENKQAPLVAKFDKQSAWEVALTKYAHCSKR